MALTTISTGGLLAPSGDATAGARPALAPRATTQQEQPSGSGTSWSAQPADDDAGMAATVRRAQASHSPAPTQQPTLKERIGFLSDQIKWYEQEQAKAANPAFYDGVIKELKADRRNLQLLQWLRMTAINSGVPADSLALELLNTANIEVDSSLPPGEAQFDPEEVPPTIKLSDSVAKDLSLVIERFESAKMIDDQGRFLDPDTGQPVDEDSPSYGFAKLRAQDTASYGKVSEILGLIAHEAAHYEDFRNGDGPANQIKFAKYAAAAKAALDKLPEGDPRRKQITHELIYRWVLMFEVEAYREQERMMALMGRLPENPLTYQNGYQQLSSDLAAQRIMAAMDYEANPALVEDLLQGEVRHPGRRNPV